jgi:hypothetical protein
MRKQSSPFIGFHSPNVGVVLRRGGTGLVLFTIFPVAAILVRPPERDHSDGCKQYLGRRRNRLRSGLLCEQGLRNWLQVGQLTAGRQNSSCQVRRHHHSRYSCIALRRLDVGPSKLEKANSPQAGPGRDRPHSPLKEGIGIA